MKFKIKCELLNEILNRISICIDKKPGVYNSNLYIDITNKNIKLYTTDHNTDILYTEPISESLIIEEPGEILINFDKVQFFISNRNKEDFANFNSTSKQLNIKIKKSQINLPINIDTQIVKNRIDNLPSDKNKLTTINTKILSQALKVTSKVKNVISSATNILTDYMCLEICKDKIICTATDGIKAGCFEIKKENEVELKLIIETSIANTIIQVCGKLDDEVIVLKNNNRYYVRGDKWVFGFNTLSINTPNIYALFTKYNEFNNSIDVNLKQLIDISNRILYYSSDINETHKPINVSIKENELTLSSSKNKSFKDVIEIVNNDKVTFDNNFSCNNLTSLLDYFKSDSYEVAKIGFDNKKQIMPILISSEDNQIRYILLPIKA